jgi:hypothetical protein
MMTNTIAVGSILFEGGTRLPKFLRLQDESDSNGWAVLKDARSEFEKTIQDAGWTFFFMAGEIKATVFGFDKEKALRSALKRLIVDVKLQRCNGIEITRITESSFLKVPYVSVFAHVRHLHKGLVFSRLN